MDWGKIQDRIFDIIVNKGHVLLAAICQGAIIGFHFKTGRDVGPNVMNTIYAFYGFLGGHFGISQKWPDKDGDGVPDAMEAHGALPDKPADPAPAAPAASCGTDGAKG
jgi:hypothetical protein